MLESQLLSRFHEIPRLPKLSQDLLSMVSKENIEFDKLAHLIELDQMLSARLLRMANSVYFGRKKDVNTILDAVIRVGLESVRTLVVAAMVSKTFTNLQTLPLKKYWTNTFTVALMLKKIAEKINLDSGQAFTSGVIHNLGELMIHSLVPEQAKLIQLRVEKGEDRLLVETDILGFSSPKLSGMLAKSWRFPDEMVDAVTHFASPNEATIAKKLAYAIHFAIDVNNHWDTMKDDKEKIIFIADHPDREVIKLSATFHDKVDNIRTNGKSLVEQMLGSA